eukprot:GHVU01140870.1.p1 GENE.GHVU01140870.1~~GHVU01140870.1.p1  ORF type:complete len:255 (+),score=31.37 GHVU01140870.1:285-1049(+)
MEGEGRGKLIQRHKIEFKEKCAQWKRLLASAGRQCRKEVESRISKEKEEVLQRHIQELKELGGDVREVPENSEELVSTSAENCEAFGDHEAAAAPKISRAARRRAKKQREQMDTSDEPSAAELEMKRIGDRLKRLGLKLYRVVGDGSCLFHALHHQLKQRHDKDIDVETENGPVTAAALRNMAADCILEHKEEFRPYITGKSLWPILSQHIWLPPVCGCEQKTSKIICRDYAPMSTEAKWKSLLSPELCEFRYW